MKSEKISDSIISNRPETQKEILAKAKRLAPAYSKGAYQYITPGSDVVDLGKRRNIDNAMKNFLIGSAIGIALAVLIHYLPMI